MAGSWGDLSGLELGDEAGFDPGSVASLGPDSAPSWGTAGGSVGWQLHMGSMTLDPGVAAAGSFLEGGADKMQVQANFVVVVFDLYFINDPASTLFYSQAR